MTTALAETAVDTSTKVWGSIALLSLLVMAVLLMLLVVVVVRAIRRSTWRAMEEERKRKRVSEAVDPWTESGRRVHMEKEEDEG